MVLVIGGKSSPHFAWTFVNRKLTSGCEKVKVYFHLEWTEVNLFQKQGHRFWQLLTEKVPLKYG